MHSMWRVLTWQVSRLITDVLVKHMRRSFFMFRVTGDVLTNSVEHLYHHTNQRSMSVCDSEMSEMKKRACCVR